MGFEGRSLAAVNAISRSHSESGFPACSAADYTSASSSGVSRVEMVLVRKPGLFSSAWDRWFACTVVVREAFMGEPSLLTCILGFLSADSCNSLEALTLQRVYAPALIDAVFVYERRRAFTGVNGEDSNC